MAQCTYFDYPGYGQRARQNMNYSQAVRIGDTVRVSGQGGWDPESGTCPRNDIGKEIDLAFSNVELALKHAGSTGWAQVYQVRCYLVAPMSADEKTEHFMRNLKAYCPGHQPLVTAVGVAGLASEHMHVEIEVAAYLGS